MKSKRYFIKTYGCQANVSDSYEIERTLIDLGFLPLDVSSSNFSSEKEEFLFALRNSDLIVINTCAVRQKSEDKAYGLGLSISNVKRNEKKSPLIIFAGCVVGSTKGDRVRNSFEELRKKTQWADAYITPNDLSKIPYILNKHEIKTSYKSAEVDQKTITPLGMNDKHAFVNVSYGCDNFCTYCVVPYAREKEIHRSKKDVLKEINILASQGITEVTLCGQNVNSWGLNRVEKSEIRLGKRTSLPFADLLREVHEIEKIEKIDFISSNPFDFTDDLIEAISLSKISNYIHIAVQSGNNDVLKRMNRKHTIGHYLDLINKLKEVKPNIEIGTDIIVGFPGETCEQFFDTVRLFEKVRFSVAFISMYSPRKGTAAERFFEDDVPKKEKKWRHKHLTEIWLKSKEG